MSTRKICVITGSRAEYGLLRSTIRGLQNKHNVDVQLIATGSHLSPLHGYTLSEIESDGFIPDRLIEILLASDSHVSVSKSIGLAVISFSEAFHQLSPDIILILGDRYEIFAAATAALIANIPIAHCHGGELTYGAFDDALRHSITKMSHHHFVAADEYRRRVLQLGEDPLSVHLVGGLGVDVISRITPLSREALEKSLEFEFAEKNLLVTFHPVTLDGIPSDAQLRELLDALSCLKDTNIIFTLPNSDTQSQLLINLIHDYCSSHSNAKAFPSLGQLRYLSCITYCDAVVGNSSSGLAEVPSFKKGTINIGTRQAGRLLASSVINCDPTSPSILSAIEKLYTPEFQHSLQHTENPYGSGGASDAIVEILSNPYLDLSVVKQFHSF